MAPPFFAFEGQCMLVPRLCRLVMCMCRLVQRLCMLVQGVCSVCACLTGRKALLERVSVIN